LLYIKCHGQFVLFIDESIIICVKRKVNKQQKFWVYSFGWFACHLKTELKAADFGHLPFF